MFPKDLVPYLVALLVLALFARRVLKAQRPRAVKMGRLWILPTILVVMTGLTLANEPAPGWLAIGAFVLAAGAGGAFGWFRVHMLEFVVDPATNAISAKSTPLGAVLLTGLLLFRYALKYMLHMEGVSGVSLLRWTDGALVFTAALLAAQSTHTWICARKLLPPSQATPISGAPE